MSVKLVKVYFAEGFAVIVAIMFKPSLKLIHALGIADEPKT